MAYFCFSPFLSFFLKKCVDFCTRRSHGVIDSVSMATDASRRYARERSCVAVCMAEGGGGGGKWNPITDRSRVVLLLRRGEAFGANYVLVERAAGSYR